MLIGYMLSIISSLFFTIYILPRKISKQKPIYYTMFVGLGYSIISIIMYIGNQLVGNSKEVIYHPILLVSAFAGFSWMLGQLLLVTAIDKIGLSRSNQWKNLQGPIGSILILIFFQESISTNLVFLFSAIAMIFVSAMLFTIKRDDEVIIDKKGIIYAIVSALFFGTNAWLRKYVTAEGFVYAQQLYGSIAVFITALIYIVIKDRNGKELLNLKDKNNYLAIVGGSIYYFASYFFVLAYNYIQGSIAFTIVQLNAVWTVLVGILVFKEMNFKKNWLRISAGIIVAIIGVVMLLFAQK